mgnify:FL=1
MALTITTIDALKKSATQYQKELLIMPVTSAQATLQHMQGMPGLKGNLVLSEINGEAELAPYKRTNVKDAEIGITARTLEMYLGNCAYNFDPNELWGTIYGSLVTQGEALKGVDINKSILMLATARMGKKLNMAIWNAKRNADGSTTKDLFNGFDTITDSEKLSEGIKADNGNYLQLTEDITEANAIDTFQKIYDAASDELQSQPVKIYCSKDIYSAYNRNYQLLHGALPYNTEFKKTYLEGTDGLWEFCPLASKKGSKYIHIAPQSNMIYGYGAGENPGETLDLGKYAPWALTLEASMAFGVQFKTLSQEMLFVAELKAKE